MDNLKVSRLKRGLAARLMGGALALAALAGPAAGGPHNCVVINGNIIIEQQGNVWIIQASDLGILQCEAFDIELFEVVRFLQPSSMARVLNYIPGAAPTNIDGTLLANGIVYFVNPAGVMFGSGAVVDVGGI